MEGRNYTNPNPGENDINPGENVVNPSSTGEIITNPNPREKIINPLREIRRNPNPGEKGINPSTGEIATNPNPGLKVINPSTGEIITIPNPGENGTDPNPGDNSTNPNSFSNFKNSAVFSEVSSTKSRALDLVYQKVHEVKKHCQVMKEKVKTTSREKEQWIRYFELVIKNVEKPDLTGFATKNKGWTALHEVACCGYEKILEKLIDETEDKNPIDETGRTPLHEAAFLGM